MFLSTKTSNRHIQEYFTNNEDDENKHVNFKNNKHKWQKAIRDDVKTWLNANIHT